MSKFTVAIILICLVVSTPLIAQLFFYNDYIQLTNEERKQFTSTSIDDLSLDEISTFKGSWNFIKGLGKFTLGNIHPIITGFYVVVSLIAVLLAIFIIRGTD